MRDVSLLAAVAIATLLRSATAFVVQFGKKIKRATFSSATAVPTDAHNTSWVPRSRFWADNEMKEMSCSELAEQMGVDIEGIKTTTLDFEQPTITRMHRNDKDVVVAVQVAAALDEKEATRVQVMAESLRNHDFFAQSQFEHRSFGPKKGGNDCTYLAPLLQLLMPELAAKVVSIVQLAWEKAGWGNCNEDSGGGGGGDLSSPMDLGIRTSEHLSYDGWRSLEPHKDDGSIYTCNIALKEPHDYEGGEFFFHTSFIDQVEVKPQRLSATVFLSDTTHGVRPITSGSRVSFVTEFWEFDDSPLGMNRPTPEDWEDFLAKQ